MKPCLYSYSKYIDVCFYVHFPDYIEIENGYECYNIIKMYMLIRALLTQYDHKRFNKSTLDITLEWFKYNVIDIIVSPLGLLGGLASSLADTLEHPKISLNKQ